MEKVVCNCGVSNCHVPAISPITYESKVPPFSCLRVTKTIHFFHEISLLGSAKWTHSPYSLHPKEAAEVYGRERKRSRVFLLAGPTYL